MASGVHVEVTDRAIITACNTPGGPIFEWRDEVGHDTAALAMAMSPVNSVLNALHRGGYVGEYKRSWGWDRVGSNGHDVRATIYNRSDHADIVEYGRRPSSGYERFTWRGASPPGATVVRPFGTRGWSGKHILAKAAAATVGAATGGAFSMTVSD